ncbi:hypothetical protein Sjap_014155 [Stephania japonica]|uniref:Importin N-terminal domain-containing protein n=1 Tax=Stephania japonica TaxID=461633 RepID=A0AAP0NZB2_9MAGN
MGVERSRGSQRVRWDRERRGGGGGLFGEEEICFCVEACILGLNCSWNVLILNGLQRGMAMSLSAADLPTIYNLIANSLSQDVALRKPAEDALSQSESRPGFCSCLMEIIMSKDLASQTDIRLMASVYFKNNINRYWRSRRDSTGISNEEKIYLRQKLLSHMREENYQISLQLSVLISKIARIDYPKEWPELFSILAQMLQSADILTSYRIFLVLYRTLKELSTKRLTSDQKNFAEISSLLFEFCWHLWQKDVQMILPAFGTLTQRFSSNASVDHHEDLYLICERWLLCLKVVRQLVVSGFQSDAKTVQEVRPVKEVCPVLLTAIQSFLPYYSSLKELHPKFWDFTKRACTKILKVLVTVQKSHPYSFGDKCVLPPVVDFCLNRIISPEPEITTFEQFLIHCMVMVKTVLECKEYKNITGRAINENGVTKEQVKKTISGVVGDMLKSLMPVERVVLLCNILIRRYFVLTASDLDEWHQDPESFHHEQDMVQWTEKLRPCAEALFIVLFENYTQLLCPVVVSILHEAMNGCPPSETAITPGMLLKDAAYGAARYVSYELSSHLNFKDWFNGALSHELMNDHPNMCIIHRKIALILGLWVTEITAVYVFGLKGVLVIVLICHEQNIVLCDIVSKIKDDIKKTVCCALIKLLQGKDLAVRLAACRSLSFLVEYSNSGQDYADVLSACLGLCFKLLQEVQELDSKVQLLHLISVLIENVNEILPLANELVDFFQKMWEESSGESLLQIQLLIALRNFVVELGYQSLICYGMLLPILQSGIDVHSPDELNLLEDSVLLWEATVANAPTMAPQLLGLFPCLVDIMERSFDHLEEAVRIIESYIILGGTDFLNMHGSGLAKLLDVIVGNVNDRGLKPTLPVIEILLQCFPREAPQLIGSTLQKLIIICLSGGDDRDPSKTDIKAYSAAILARVLVINTDYLAHLSSEQSLLLALQQAGVAVDDNVLLSLVNAWLEMMDNATDIQRKAYGLALAIILTLRLPQVLDILDQILSACTTVMLGGVRDLNDEESSCDDAVSPGSHRKSIVPNKDFRKRQVLASDPIKQLSLVTVVRENLQICANLHGETSFNVAVSRMHPAAFAQLQQALKIV